MSRSPKRMPGRPPRPPAGRRSPPAPYAVTF